MIDETEVEMDTEKDTEAGESVMGEIAGTEDIVHARVIANEEGGIFLGRGVETDEIVTRIDITGIVLGVTRLTDLEKIPDIMKGTTVTNNTEGIAIHGSKLCIMGSVFGAVDYTNFLY